MKCSGVLMQSSPVNVLNDERAGDGCYQSKHSRQVRLVMTPRASESLAKHSGRPMRGSESLVK